MRSILAGLTVLVLAAPLSAQEKKVIAGPQRAPAANANPAQPPRPRPLSPAIQYGNLLFVSGMTGAAPATDSTAPNDTKAQTTRTLENIKRIVEEAGTTMERGLHCTVFLMDIKDFQAMNEAYTAFFSKDPPTRSTVQVAALAGATAKVEIECQFGMPGK